jgi:hypothetical protein
LFIFGYGYFIFVVEQFVQVVAVFDIIFVADGVESGEIGDVTSHVCCQNESDDVLSENFELVFGHFFQEIEFFLI